MIKPGTLLRTLRTIDERVRDKDQKGTTNTVIVKPGTLVEYVNDFILASDFYFVWCPSEQLYFASYDIDFEPWN